MSKKIALPTLHGKGAQIIPPFNQLHPFEIEEVAIDTDSFGTFSGERERTLSPLDAAIAKAKEAIDVTGWDGAIASEGSIGSDPALPFAISDREVMVFIDTKEGLIVHESFRSFEIIAARREFHQGDDLDSFLKRADFPRHRLIVTTTHGGSILALKGIASREGLETAISQALAKSDDGNLVIESDLRAHCSPSRQLNIAKSAHLLAHRLTQRCPGCEAMGWGRVDYEFGVECRECGHIDMRVARSEIEGCARCPQRRVGKVMREMIDAGDCERCNP